MKDLRIGRFRITEAIIDANPKAVRKLMGKVIVVRAEFMYGHNFEYIAISPEFDKIEEGLEVPKYDIIATNKVQGKKNILDKITFKRIN